MSIPAVAIVIGVATFILNAWLVFGASTASSLYYAFPISMANSPILFFAYIAIVVGMYKGLEYCLNLYEDNYDKGRVIELFRIVVWIFICLAVTGWFAGFSFYERFERKCWLTSACPAGTIGGVFGTFASIPYFFLSLAFLPALATVAAGTSPAWVGALIAMSTTHPAEQAVTRTVHRKRPDTEIERELWEIMRRQDVSDAQIQRTFDELSPLRKWVLKIQYEKRAREARRLRELAQAQARAFREEGDLAHSVHALERERRKGGEWR